MTIFNIALLSNLLINISLDIMENSWNRSQCLLISFIVSLTFLLDESKWMLPNTDKFYAWLKRFVVSYLTCEITILVNFIYILLNKYSVTSISWYAPSMVMFGLLIYRYHRKN